MNRWNIPEWLEKEVRERDLRCIYCNLKFGSDGTRKTTASWEHIVNDEGIVTRENIALCCFSCNASKGAKELSVWLETDYCMRRRISRDTVADIVRMALVR